MRVLCGFANISCGLLHKCHLTHLGDVYSPQKVCTSLGVDVFLIGRFKNPIYVTFQMVTVQGCFFSHRNIFNEQARATVLLSAKVVFST